MGCTSGNAKRTGSITLQHLSQVLERGQLTDPGKRWESVPDDCINWNMTGGWTGVWLNPGERVRWTFVHNTDGTKRVIGYTILQEGE